jgi:hypothetical protein
MTLPDRGLSRFIDMETDERLVVHTESLREAWKSEMQNHIQGLRKLSAGRQVDYSLALTDQSWFHLFDRLA